MTWVREVLGGTLTSPPSAVFSQNRILVFSKGLDDALWLHIISGPGPATTSLVRLGGRLTSPPYAVNYGGQNGLGNYVGVFAKGSGSEVLVWWWPQFAAVVPIREPSRFGSMTISAPPTAISRQFNDLEVFVTRNRELFHTWWIPTQARWARWESLGGDLRSEPSVIRSYVRPTPTARLSDQIHVYARGGPQQVGVHRWNDAPSWGTWFTSTTWPIQSAPVAVQWNFRDDLTRHMVLFQDASPVAEGELSVFEWSGIPGGAGQEDGRLRFFAELGKVYSSPSSLSLKPVDTRMFVFARFSDGTVKYRYTNNGFTWTLAWRTLPGDGQEKPHAIGWGGGALGWLNVFSVTGSGELVRWYPADWTDV